VILLVIASEGGEEPEGVRKKQSILVQQLGANGFNVEAQRPATKEELINLFKKKYLVERYSMDDKSAFENYFHNIDTINDHHSVNTRITDVWLFTKGR
jgi:hypothetical protein